MNFLGLFTSAFPLGAIGLNKYFSEYFETGKIKEINFLLKKFILLNLYITIPFVVLIIFFSEQISYVLFSDTQYSLLIILLSCSLPLSILTGFFDVYLRGVRKINSYVFFVTLNSVLSVLIFVPLQIYFHLTGVFVSLIVIGIVSVINGVVLLKRIKLFPDLSKISIVENEVSGNILKFGLANIAMLATQQLSLLAIRLFINSKYSITESGIFQSVFSISNNYFGLFFTIMAAYALPKLSSFGNDTFKIKMEINNLLKLFLLLYTPIIIIIFILRDTVLTLLYSKDFISAGNLFGLQLSGDFLKAISWSLGLWFIPMLKIKEWLIFDLIYSFNFFMIFYLFQIFSELGVISVSISYLLTNLVHLIINFIYIKKNLQFKFDPEVFKILITSTLCIFLVFVSALVVAKPYSYLFLIIPVIFILLNFKKDEFLKFMELLKISGKKSN